jgi:hypothetical protein
VEGVKSGWVLKGGYFWWGIETACCRESGGSEWVGGNGEVFGL